MIASQIWTHAWESALFDHLWQSTAVAVAAWLLTFAMRNNSARVRYFIWVCASIKFLVPFELLMILGAHWAKPEFRVQSGHVFSYVAEEITRPLQSNQSPVSAISPVASQWHASSAFWAIVALSWLCGFVIVLAKWFSGWRRAVALAKNAEPVRAGREFEALQLAGRRSGIRKEIELRSSASEIEPGIFGVIRPILLWPIGLSDRLNDAQVEAIMAHEAEHVCRHDNLTAAAHALVEALFWFHPLVRWMSTRMAEERERACDEKVIQLNAHPETYAESILKVCGFCLEPSAACVSGVSGADLKDRILRIMTCRNGVALSTGRKVILFAAALLTLVLPLGIGMVRGQTSAAASASFAQSPGTPSDVPKFDVASIKHNKAGDNRMMMRISPDGVSLQGMPLRELVQSAFGIEADRIIGEPDWVKSSRYDIEAKVAPEDAPRLKDLKLEQRNAMMLQLLVDRFNLKYHHETRELPMYALVISKSGLKMKPTKPGSGSDPLPPPEPSRHGDGERPAIGEHMLMMNPGHLQSTGATLNMLAHILSRQLGRTVVDKTGLTGEWDFVLDYEQENMPSLIPGAPDGSPKPEIPADQGKPSLFTAVEEQLGLKLEATKAVVDVIVIDHIDQPTEN